jgi:aspartate oxidase
MTARPAIVVVGSGAAGLAAALAAAESAREKDVACRITLIEKAPRGAHGGNTRWSPSYMRMAAPDRVEASFADDLDTISGGRAIRPASMQRAPTVSPQPPISRRRSRAGPGRWTARPISPTR